MLIAWRYLLSVIFLGNFAAAQSNETGKASEFPIVEATIPQLQEALKRGRVTSQELVRLYLIRIATYNDQLHATIAVNPRALAEAAALDRERKQGRTRGPLHGIPVALKDNVQTTMLPTTGGALAFLGFVPSYESTIARRLREAGAIVLAKTTMTELANWVAGAPTPMPGGYNAIAGFSYNPYDPRRDPRPNTADGRPALTVSGSSSAVGTAVSFWTASVGTETSGSILSPANSNMLVGIKPTVGRISRHGVIPITADQDTPGPMARTVGDAAILLGILESADPHDSATGRCAPPPNHDYTRFLNKGGLKGARIGIPRAFFYDALTPPGEKEPRGGIAEDRKRLMEEAIAVLRAQGAIIVDPANIPSVTASDRDDNFALWGVCSGADEGKGKDEGCSTVLKYGMKRDFNEWLASLGSSAPVKSLTELRQFNLNHQRASSMKFGQAALDISDEMNIVEDRLRYESDRAKDIRLTATEGIDAVMKEYRLDAILFPGSTGASIAARPGYPTVIVPFGMVSNSPTPPFPDGFGAKAAPFGISFTATACSEQRLIELGYAFEQATKRRIPPPLFP